MTLMLIVTLTCVTCVDDCSKCLSLHPHHSQLLVQLLDIVWRCLSLSLVVQILDPCDVVDLGSKHGSEVRRGSGKYEFVTAELWAIISSHLGPGVEYEFLRTSLAALLAAIYLHMWD